MHARPAWITVALCLCFGGVAATTARARASFDAAVLDDSVIQRGANWTVGGTTDDASPVVVRLGSQRFEARPERGRWSLAVPIPADAAGALELSIEGSSQTRRALAGEVWLCSGQSNMALTVAKAEDGAAIVAGAQGLPLRLLKVKPPTRQTGAQQLPWQKADPTAVRDFSAVCLAFGKELQRRIGVPVGLVDASMGGTRIEAWISAATLPEALARDDAFRRAGDGEDRRDGDGFAKNEASVLADAMISPLVGMPLRGVLWYQGESNRLNAQVYAELLGRLMKDWRRQWKNETLPFVIMQLPGFGPPDLPFAPFSPFAAVREAQGRAAAADGHAVTVSTIDLGDVELHPLRKAEFGRRAAQMAERSFYGSALPVRPGMPVASASGGTISVDLRPLSSCVQATAPLASSVWIAGVDRNWQPAEAELAGLRLTARSSRVARPVALRYAWADRPQAVLRDCARDQPLPGFRTDDWPVARPARP